MKIIWYFSGFMCVFFFQMQAPITLHRLQLEGGIVSARFLLGKKWKSLFYESVQMLKLQIEFWSPIEMAALLTNLTDLLSKWELAALSNDFYLQVHDLYNKVCQNILKKFIADIHVKSRSMFAINLTLRQLCTKDTWKFDQFAWKCT